MLYLGHDTIYNSCSQPPRGKKRVKGAARQELMTRMEELRHSAKHVAKKGQKSQGVIGRCDVCTAAGWHI